ncbi:EAL domain-containing protein [Desulfobacula sp.]|uniref:bifunctional diguanylate cyclase/phosphodiesterase n=1 Tax=Desulfobacula sp. TaxID=2593537 RepID=UPI002617CE05|nr:EAL domain-containing protein [Desulfobacula sp.]
MKHAIDFNHQNMAPYVRMLRSVLGSDLVCAIIDEHYQPLWQAGGDDGDPMEGLLGRLKDTPLHPGSLSERISAGCPENRLTLIQDLDLEYIDGELYFIGLVARGTPEFSRADMFQDYFSDVVACICSQYNLRMENDNMVQELSQRYEELNFLYQTENPNNETETSEESLGDLVKEMTEFMDVEAACLWLPDMGYWFFHMAGRTGDIDNETHIRNWVTPLFETIKKTGQPMVVNKHGNIIQDSSASVLSAEVMMVFPVLNSDLQAMGLIGCLRRRGGRAFVTGDQKLMEVTARRVRKIIHSDLDDLTGLANRVGFEKKLEELVSDPSQIRRAAAVSLFNIDQFKLLNDAYGMAAGDDVLKQVAVVLKTHFRDQDFLARIKGDEFAVILFDLHSVAHGQEVLERIRKQFSRQQFMFQDTRIHIKVRIGMVPIAWPIKEISDVIAKAEIAVQSSRERGGDTISVYTEGDSRLAEKQTQARTATQIETLVENRQFVLFCQPVVPLQGGRMHYEILIRLKDEKGNIIAPGQFLPAAERYNKMPFIDQWVLEETCRLLKASEPFLSAVNISWAVNLSGQSLQDEVFLKYFLSFLSQLPFPASWLNFEITETVAIRNFDRVIHVMDQITRMGFAISLDDFGSGYSSFAYLKQLPISFLKIDGMFVQHLHTDTLAQVMVTSIATISKHLKIKTIAEFVENEKILDFLRRGGIDYAQGYHTGKPFPLRDALERIQQQDVCRET